MYALGYYLAENDGMLTYATCWKRISDTASGRMIIQIYSDGTYDKQYQILDVFSGGRARYRKITKKEKYVILNIINGGLIDDQLRKI